MTLDIELTDMEAEKTVVSAMVYKPALADIGLSELTKLHFANPDNQRIFEAVNSLADTDQEINVVAVWNMVKDVVGGGLKSLLADFVGDSVFRSSVDRLKKIYQARKLYQLSQQIAEDVGNKLKPDEIAVRIEDALYEAVNETEIVPIVTPQKQAELILETIGERMDKEKRYSQCVYTSFEALNKRTGGFEAGDLVIISGPTGGGKTALAMNLMRDIAVDQKLPILHINTEMSQKQIDMRWGAIISGDYGVNNATIRNGEISQQQFSNLTAQLNNMFKSELYSVTIADLTVPKMLSTIRRFSRQKKIRAVTVDYIGRVDTMNSNKDDWKQLLSAAKKLKTLGQKLGLVIFMIAQNNSEGNLAMAGYMEHEADLHLQVRPLTEDELETYARSQETYWNYAMLIKKGRSSPKGKIPMRFVGEKLTFVMNDKEAMRYARLAAEQQKPKEDSEANEPQAEDSQNSSWQRRNFSKSRPAFA
ncbi:MAG: Replicative helicase (DnaB) [Firmicutes bacterium]|nr:Replicative helicase (DnaB) [Bacillota bacterium]